MIGSQQARDVVPPGDSPGANACAPALVDTFGRVHTDLRISVTDRCNIRCFYCMPADNPHFLPTDELLSFDEIERLVRVVARLGVTKLRLTGGEPLVRPDLPQLVERLRRVPGIDDLALSTNGILLAEQAQALKSAGLTRVNISLDAMTAEVFERVARRKGFERVLEGIAAAERAGFEPIKLNAVAVRGINEGEIVPLARFARSHHFHLRFIEFMPLDADGRWNPAQVLAGDEIRATIEQSLGPLQPVPGADPHQPAVDYQFDDGVGTIGFINTVTQPFCADCNRLRVTAEGQLRNCLFATDEWDARRALRAGATDADLAALVRECIGAKRAGHGINSDDFLRPRRAMFQIGG